MSGPWQNYAPQQAAQAGPWAKYGAQQSNALSDAYRQAFLAGDTVKAHQIAVQARQQGVKIAPISDTDIDQSVDQRFNQSVQNESKGQQALEGAGKSFADTGQGLGELVGAVSPQEVAQTRQQGAPLMNTGAGGLGYAGGFVAQAAIPFSDGVKGISMLGKAAPYVATALNGALIGGAQPVAGDESRVTNALIGAGGNAVGLGAGRLLGLAGRGTSKLVPRSGTLERKAASAILGSSANPESVRAALANAPLQVVPGSSPTLAMLTGDTGLAGMQRTLQSVSPDFNNQVTQLGMNNNAARADFIRRMFGGADQSGINAAESARDEASKPLLQQALSGGGVNTQAVMNHGNEVLAGLTGDNASQNVIRGVLSNMQGVVPEADRLAAAKQTIQSVLKGSKKASGPDYQALTAARRAITQAQRNGGGVDDALNTINSLSGRSPTVSQALSDAADTLGNANVLNTDVKSLYNTRKAIDNLLQGRAENSAAARGVKRQLLSIKDVLDTELSKASPEFGQYLDTYASMSRPVDQAQVGKYLLDKAAPVADAQGNPVLYPATTSRMLNNPDALVQSATGFGKATAARSLTPEQMEGLHALGEDLRRQNVINSGKSVGSDTTQKLFGAQSIQNQIGPFAALALTHNPTTAVGVAALNAVRKQFGAKAAALAQEAMLDPSRAAELMQSLSPTAREQLLVTLQPYFRMFGQGVSGAAARGVQQELAPASTSAQ